LRKIFLGLGGEGLIVDSWFGWLGHAQGRWTFSRMELILTIFGRWYVELFVLVPQRFC
jgi:hypothetical protein